jgi:predicted translin family RNA/ssDNA-binding protein
MTGTVTIQLKDFDKLREAESKAEESLAGLTRAAKELEVFLSFLVTRENISEYVEEFNRQSQRSTISVVDGRAKIAFNHAPKNKD